MTRRYFLIFEEYVDTNFKKINVMMLALFLAHTEIIWYEHMQAIAPVHTNL